MSFRVARQAFSTARSSIRSSRANAPTFRTGARRMNSSHAHPESSSDKKWIITSAIVFGPAFLYLISPSARKNTHAVHHDSHDFPGHKEHKKHEPAPEPEPVIAKDDEGTEANVTESIQQAEAKDAPKADGANPTETAAAPEAKSDEAKPEEAKPEEAKPDANEPQQANEADSSKDKETDEKKEKFQRRAEKGPMETGEVREAAMEGTTPKEKSKEAGSA